MKKFKKKFLLTGLALAVPLVGAIASACSEVSQDGPTPPTGGNNGGTTGSGSGGTTSLRRNSENILENLPMFFLDLEK
ncbi:hypothetical protein [Mycoplasma amphoriforme]|uniref:Variable surface lipoprotein n=1 Tax=Mycoplasma amphoriforme A39 TaxID=572419 RepID=A0A292IIE9_9MOLU|nr:unnamed protein product [Mycoplasma amphoriforme A39]